MSEAQYSSPGHERAGLERPPRLAHAAMMKIAVGSAGTPETRLEAARLALKHAERGGFADQSDSSASRSYGGYDPYRYTPLRKRLNDQISALEQRIASAKAEARKESA